MKNLKSVRLKNGSAKRKGTCHSLTDFGIFAQIDRFDSV